MLEKFQAVLASVWSNRLPWTWVETAMVVVPLVFLVAYIIFVLYLTKIKFIPGTPNKADLTYLILYFMSLGTALAFHIFLHVGPFVSSFGAYLFFILAYKAYWRFVRYMAWRDNLKNIRARVAAQKKIVAYHREKRMEARRREMEEWRRQQEHKSQNKDERKED